MRKGTFLDTGHITAGAKKRTRDRSYSDIVDVWASIPQPAQRITGRYLDPLDTLSRGHRCSLLLVYIPYNEAGILWICLVMQIAGR